MSRARAAFRLTCFLTWSGVLFVIYQPFRLAGLAWPSLANRPQTALCRLWARGVAAIVGLRVATRGEPPSAPFVLVSNHLGYLDIITLLSRVPGVFVSRADLAGWPVLGALARAAGTIFIDRSLRRDVARVNVQIQRVLDGGRGVLMFPEGTSSAGRDVLPFRSSLLEPAVAACQPVNYASLGYATLSGCPQASEAVCWWGEMTFLDHFLRLLSLPRIEATLTFGSEPLSAPTRHELAQRLHHAVAAQHRPVA